jgi:sigma-B regulation protein RsbU (phosphoserine phosphatase)
LSVTLSRLLSPPRDPSSVLVRASNGLDGDSLGGPPIPLHPADVADELSRRFPFDPVTGQFFTMLYGLFDVVTGRFEYVSAGHPGLAHVPTTGAPRIVDVPGYPIGLAPSGYESHVLDLEPGDRLYLYSDGITDAMNPTGVLYGAQRLLGGLMRGRSVPLVQSVSDLRADVESWSGSRRRDDLSLLAVEFGPAGGAANPGVP